MERILNVGSADTEALPVTALKIRERLRRRQVHTGWGTEKSVDAARVDDKPLLTVLFLHEKKPSRQISEKLST